MMNQERVYTVIRRPIVTEKSTMATEKANQVVFEVAADATKPEVKTAVEALFKVSVTSVSLLNQKGKNKMFGRRPGRRNDVRKAYVTLKAGDAIDFSAAV